MAEDPTEVLAVDPQDSTLEPLPTAGPGESDKVAPPRVAMSLLLVVALIGGLLGGGIVALATRSSRNGTSLTFAPGTNLKLRNGALDVQGVLAKTEPAVVSIETDGFVQQNGFFGPTVQRVTGAGTGMVLTSDGEILTNNHVIEGAQKITVTFAGQQQPRPADLVGADPVNDVAIIKVRNASGLKTVTLGNSSQLEVGDDVIAIGNALALVGGNTVTKGIVSALNRSIDDPQENLSHLIQTDAAINAGNSGGPLLNAKGEVVGMNTVVIRGDGSGATVESIGFAIAIDSIKPLIDQLRSGKSGAAQGSPFIGVATVSLTPDLKAQLGVPVDNGAVVQDVTAGSPSENAGIRVGDVITKFDGKDVASSSDLVAAVRASKAGAKVSFTYYRGGDKRTGTLTVGSRSVSQ
ncbi:MAG TPA: trypsin-like peptidase domain-containing protein [Acidimicrobiales bacterium]|nr:trypsin-like peptidase domain-containing protein [Acidimicrobiales bacterium]